MSWTEERRRIALKLWSDGLSASQVAAELGGVTRSAVLGILHRMQAPKRNTLRPKPVTSPRPRRVPSPHGNSRKGNGEKRVQRFLTVSEKLVPDEFTPRADVLMLGIPFNDLGPDACRWIDGEPTADAPACGHPTSANSPWCPAHRRIVYQPPARPHFLNLTEAERARRVMQGRKNFRKTVAEAI